jgi:hypothetical protein
MLQPVNVQILVTLKTGHIVAVTLMVAEEEVLAVCGINVLPIGKRLLYGRQRRMIVHLILYPVLL